MDEKTLEKLAVEELLRDAKRGKERYKTMGPSGWQKNLVPRANKQFLHRTLASSLHASARREATALPKRKLDDQQHVSDKKSKISKPVKNPVSKKRVKEVKRLDSRNSKDKAETSKSTSIPKKSST